MVVSLKYRCFSPSVSPSLPLSLKNSSEILKELLSLIHYSFYPDKHILLEDIFSVEYKLTTDTMNWPELARMGELDDIRN